MGTAPWRYVGPATLLLGAALIACVGNGPVLAQPAAARARFVRLEEVQSLLADALPAAIRDGTPAARERAFEDWLRIRERQIRARVLRADEDALVPLLLFGTSFTKAPRLTTAFFVGRQGSPPAESERAFAAAFAQRTDDLLAALASAAAE